MAFLSFPLLSYLLLTIVAVCSPLLSVADHICSPLSIFLASSSWPWMMLMTCICITEHKPFVGDDFLLSWEHLPKNASATDHGWCCLFICFSLEEDLVVLGQLRIQSEIFLEPYSLSLISIFLSAHEINNVTWKLRQSAFVQCWFVESH